MTKILHQATPVNFESGASGASASCLAFTVLFQRRCMIFFHPPSKVAHVLRMVRSMCIGLLRALGRGVHVALTRKRRCGVANFCLNIMLRCARWPETSWWERPLYLSCRRSRARAAGLYAGACKCSCRLGLHMLLHAVGGDVRSVAARVETGSACGIDAQLSVWRC